MLAIIEKNYKSTNIKLTSIDKEVPVSELVLLKEGKADKNGDKPFTVGVLPAIRIKEQHGITANQAKYLAREAGRHLNTAMAKATAELSSRGNEYVGKRFTVNAKGDMFTFVWAEKGEVSENGSNKAAKAKAAAAVKSKIEAAEKALKEKEQENMDLAKKFEALMKEHEAMKADIAAAHAAMASK